MVTLKKFTALQSLSLQLSPVLKRIVPFRALQTNPGADADEHVIMFNPLGLRSQKLRMILYTLNDVEKTFQLARFVRARGTRGAG